MWKLLLQYSYCLEVALCLAVLAAILLRSFGSNFKALSGLLAARIVNKLFLIGFLFHRAKLGVSRERALQILFVQGWLIGVVEGGLVFILIYTTFWEAMRPLEGLHSIGKVIFRWVSGVSVLFAAAVALGPHDKAADITRSLAWRFDDGISVLTLCLLLFVCFAISPLGLTFRSRVFGISLGLGLMTVIDLIQNGWLASVSATSLYSPIYLISSIGAVVGLSIWLGYFLIDEPERMMILLPTTSPFFFWNRVSEVLGDDPGYVAVGGIKPQMFAAAELKVLSAAHKQAGAALPAGAEVLADSGDSLPSAASQ